MSPKKSLFWAVGIGDIFALRCTAGTSVKWRNGDNEGKEWGEYEKGAEKEEKSFLR